MYFEFISNSEHSPLTVMQSYCFANGLPAQTGGFWLSAIKFLNSIFGRPKMEINLYGKVLKFEPMDVEECTDSRGIKIKTFGKYITEGGRTYTLFSFEDLDNASYSTYKCYWHRQKGCQALLRFNHNTRIIKNFYEHSCTCK